MPVRSSSVCNATLTPRLIRCVCVCVSLCKSWSASLGGSGNGGALGARTSAFEACWAAWVTVCSKLKCHMKNMLHASLSMSCQLSMWPHPQLSHHPLLDEQQQVLHQPHGLPLQHLVLQSLLPGSHLQAQPKLHHLDPHDFQTHHFHDLHLKLKPQTKEFLTFCHNCDNSAHTITLGWMIKRRDVEAHSVPQCTKVRHLPWLWWCGIGPWSAGKAKEALLINECSTSARTILTTCRPSTKGAWSTLIWPKTAMLSFCSWSGMFICFTTSMDQDLLSAIYSKALFKKITKAQNLGMIWPPALSPFQPLLQLASNQNAALFLVPQGPFQLASKRTAAFFWHSKGLGLFCSNSVPARFQGPTKSFFWPAPCAFGGSRCIETYSSYHVTIAAPVPGGNRSAASCLCRSRDGHYYHYSTRSPFQGPTNRFKMMANLFVKHRGCPFLIWSIWTSFAKSSCRNTSRI